MTEEPSARSRDVVPALREPGSPIMSPSRVCASPKDPTSSLTAPLWSPVSLYLCDGHSGPCHLGPTWTQNSDNVISIQHGQARASLCSRIQPAGKMPLESCMGILSMGRIHVTQELNGSYSTRVPSMGCIGRVLNCSIQFLPQDPGLFVQPLTEQGAFQPRPE